MVVFSMLPTDRRPLLLEKNVLFKILAQSYNYFAQFSSLFVRTNLKILTK